MTSPKRLRIYSSDPEVTELLHKIPKLHCFFSEQATETEPIDLFLVDLDLPPGDAVAICRRLKADAATADTPIILLTQPVDNEELLGCLGAEVEDYVLKPLSSVELQARVDVLLRPRNYYEELEHQDLCMLLGLSESISAARNPMSILRRIVEKMSSVVEVARCSIVSVNSSDELIVKASSDLFPGQEITLDLQRYPEINEALKTQKTVIVNDLKQDVRMASVRQHLSGLNFNSIVVVPIFRQGSVIGTFLLRTTSLLPEGITGRIYKLTQMIANISAGALENAILFQTVNNAQKYYEEMSIRDGLTNLYNHRHFYGRLDEEFLRSKRHLTSLSCIFMDLDDFKYINDRHGHLFGDDVLRKVSRVIEEAIRETDFPARYGGDEFAIILPNTTAEGAMEVAVRLKQGLEKAMGSGELCAAITSSLGVSTYVSGNMKTAKQLLQQADKAMYLSKSSGKGKISYLD